LRSLTDEEKERVENALEVAFDDPNVVANLQSSLEMHLFAANWNWGDATTEPLRRIIGNPRCDKGTTALIYWMGDPVSLYERAETRQDVENEYRLAHYDLFKEIEQRIESGFYVQENIRFDPKSDWIPGLTQSEALKQPIPNALLEATPGIIVDQKL
jgi:hypothetical protein